MLSNNTSLLSEETINKLNELGIRPINTGREPLTEETALEIIEFIINDTFFKEDN